MTKQRAAELAPVMAAWADGKTIQYRFNEPTDVWWSDTDTPSFELTEFLFRIKPEPRDAEKLLRKIEFLLQNPSE